MKKILIALLILFVVNKIAAQNVAINTSGSTADNSSMLDVSSNNKGVIFPRMSKAQKLAISTPATGLLVFQTGPDSIGFYYYNGSNWLWLNGEEDKYWKASGNHIYNTNIDRVGIGTNNPLARLHVADSSVVFGNSNFNAAPTPANPPISGAGKRTMWYADKVAFRTGSINGNHWNKDSIGNGSFATGYNTIASGTYSVAIGVSNKASGLASVSMGGSCDALNDYAFAMGRLNNATGLYSVAFGNQNNTTRYASTVFGENNNANGDFSIAFGRFNSVTDQCSMVAGLENRAKSFASFVTGRYNDTTNTNRLFEIGNGTANNNRSNAVTVITSGNMGIGVTNPANKLEVNGTTTTNALVVGGGTTTNKLQSGTLAVGPNGGQTLTVTLTFPSAFAAPPKVFANASTETGQTFNDGFSVTTRSISNTDCVLIITRTDSNAAWLQNLKVDWMAIQ